MSKKNTSTAKNGKTLVGIPHGSMNPPKAVSDAIKGFAVILDKEAWKAELSTFHSDFFKKYPKAFIQDFARQFDKTIGFERKEYRAHKTFNAVVNALRYMPKDSKAPGKGKGKGKGRKASRRADKITAVKNELDRVSRLLVAMCNQIGIDNDMLLASALVFDFSPAEVEKLKAVDGALIEIPALSNYVLTVRHGINAGLKAVEAKLGRRIVTAADKAPVVTVAPSAELPASKFKGKKPSVDRKAPKSATV